MLIMRINNVGDDAVLLFTSPISCKLMIIFNLKTNQKVCSLLHDKNVVLIFVFKQIQGRRWSWLTKTLLKLMFKSVVYVNNTEVGLSWTWPSGEARHTSPSSLTLARIDVRAMCTK